MQDGDESYDGAGVPAKQSAPDPVHLANLPDAQRADDLGLYSVPRSDMGNAERLIKLFGDDLAFVDDGKGKGTGTWYVWDGSVWDSNAGELAARKRAQRTAEAVVGEAMRRKARQAKGYETYRDWGFAMQNSSRISNMIREAAPDLARRREDFDADALTLVVQNGTIRLPPRWRSASGGGPVRPVFQGRFNRGDFVSRMLPVTYDPNARCPKFEGFLDRILPDADVRDFLKCWFGYCLSGDVSAEMLLLFYGQGANGKSTLLNIMAAILAPYCVTLPFASFQPDKNASGSSHTADISRVEGMRLVRASEPNGTPVLAEGTIKMQTGREAMYSRDLHEKGREFMPSHKVVLSFNKRPVVNAQDNGTWRRLAMVPFDESIPPDERVPDLDKIILEEEASGVLNWMLDGWEIFASRGYIPHKPEAVRAATEDYQAASDPLGGWAAESLIFHVQPQSEGTSKPRPYADPGPNGENPPRETGAALRASYEAWAQEAGEEPLGKKRFGQLLKDHRHMTYRKVSSTFYYGVKVKAGKTGEKKDGMV